MLGCDSARAMTDENRLIARVRDVMANTFGVDEQDLPVEPSMQSLRRWTSLQHMTLMVALEEAFAVRLSMTDMTSMTSLTAIVQVLSRRLATAA